MRSGVDDDRVGDLVVQRAAVVGEDEKRIGEAEERAEDRDRSR